MDIARRIHRYIHLHAIPHGGRLPSERSLAEEYACNHLTIRKALRTLEQNGLIYKVPSVGSFAGPCPEEPDASGLVGIIFPDGELYYYRLLIQLEVVFARFHLYPIVKLTGSNAGREDETLQFFQKKKVRAVISAPNILCIKQYEKMHCPVIFFDLYPGKTQIPHVISDDFSGAFAAADYLCSLGHERIAYIGSRLDPASEKRCEGYLAALNKNGIKVEKRYIKKKVLTREWGMQASARLLGMKKRPSAILCGNDTAAAGVIRYCSAKGIRIPENLSLIGFGNTEIAEDLSLTSVSQNSDQIAEAIAGSLAMMFDGKEVPQEIKIPEKILHRNSTAKPRA